MHSPPLTPGHDSNNDDPDLASLDKIVARLRIKIAKQKQEARVVDPNQVMELQEQLRVEREKCALLEQQKKELDNACTYAEIQALAMILENEQLRII